MERPELSRDERKRLRAFVKAAAVLYAPYRNPNARGGRKARLRTWPVDCTSDDSFAFGETDKSQRETVLVWNSDGTQRQVVLLKEETDYLVASDQWPSMKYVLEHFTERLKIPADEAFKLFPLIYDFIYGVATAARVEIEGVTHLYMGIRADASIIAGMNAGMLSLPAGLVNRPDETVIEAALREFRGEGGLDLDLELRPGVAFGPHNAAPSITFVALGDVREHVETRPSFEWKGKKMLPVPEEFVRMFLDDPNQHRELRTFLFTKGVQVDKIQIAPDIVEPLKTMLRVYPD